MKFSLISLILLSLGIVNSSSKVPETRKFPVKSQEIKRYVTISQFLESQGRFPDGTPILPSTRKFYKNHDFVPVWYPNGQLSKAAQVAEDVLENSHEEGLMPKDYLRDEGPVTPENWVQKEIHLTNRFLKFIRDVRVGRIPPSHISRHIKLTSPETDQVFLLSEALKDGANSFQKLREMSPELEDYQNLKKLLKAYRTLYNRKGNKETPPLTPSLKKLTINQSHEEVPNLKKILFSQGFLLSKDTSPVFDVETKEALKRFQVYHSIENDGKIGNDTLAALNWDLGKRILKIAVNMERLRWLPDHLGKKFIIVNVGGYEVMAVEDGKVVHRIKAIVGQTGRKTPLFYSPLKNIVINPSWGVPHSILVRDKLPKIIQDPGYVAKAGFTVYDASGQKLDPYLVNWESQASGIRLRQSPGAHNALGRIKFNIENPYTIYLHGTPTDKLFKKGKRNFSSGCIRLENPNLLAAWVLKDVNGWSEKDIQENIEKGYTLTVSLKNQLPVYFTYLTVWVDENQKSHFSSDAYRLDEALIKALEEQGEI